MEYKHIDEDSFQVLAGGYYYLFHNGKTDQKIAELIFFEVNMDKVKHFIICAKEWLGYEAVPWEEIENATNRYFGSEEACRKWLEEFVKLLEESLDQKIKDDQL